jgi:hypothetical protein
MPNTFTIEIGPNGFKAPNKKPKFKVKKSQPVEFNLVDGAQSVDIYFAAGTSGPFGVNPLSVSGTGTGPLALQSATVGTTYAMSTGPAPTEPAPEEPPVPTPDNGTEPPPDEDPTVRDGRVGDLEVGPG